MKKIIVLLSLALIFTCSIFIKPKDFSLTDYFDEGVLYTYTSRPINDTSIHLAGTYMSFNSKGANKEDIIGECLYLDYAEINSVLSKLKAKVKFTEYIEEQQLTIIYSYSSLIPLSKNINNHKVNLQISSCKEYCAIGWPVIYSGF